MNDPFREIQSSGRLLAGTLQQLIESGFAIIPGPLSGERFDHLVAAYDAAIATGAGPAFKVGTTTTRMSDLLIHSCIFSEVFLHPPLLEACSHVIGQPFKLSSFLARTLRAGTPAQELHSDLPRKFGDAPLLGFILMVDPFRQENGATRFVPNSHRWPDVPADRLVDTCSECPGELLGCGDAGTMILFNGAIWHGHSANVTAHPRRSIQGYFVRRNVHSGFDFRDRLVPAVEARMKPLARYLLALDEQ